ncbi:AAA family ATPase [uncultured Methanobrevibacter sp.]|uniref:AAA family ATPase n=1 Tax=uncultured Methanobrevibacter sp. TaxID=253161 RepID=UPI0025D41B84|nr:AAA family ATPase [uncultured Methanobrevibacter sp.]
MIIESIKIENFRQYKGPIKVDFSLDKDKNFTIIRGTNGAGKTNLLNALTWCLYGKELHKADTSAAGGPIYNLITKNKTGPGENFDVLVEVSMLDEYESRVIVKRTLNYSCDENGVLARDYNGSQFNIFYSIDGNDKPLAHPDLFIEKHMPKDIEGYFFFDGEKLEDYFDENSGSSISDTVHELSQLHLIKTAIAKLNTRKNAFTSEMKKIDTGAGNLTERENKAKDKKRRAEKRKSDAEYELKEVEEKLETAREELHKIDHADAKKLQNQIKKLKITERSLESNIKVNTNKKRELLISNFPLVYSYSAMKYSCDLGEDLEEAGFIPPQYKKEFLDTLLEKKECICGCDLTENQDAYIKLVNLKNNTSEITNVSEEVNVVLREFKSTMRRVSKFNDNRQEFNKEIRENSKKLAEVKEEIESLEFEYGQINHPLIKKLKQDIFDLDHRRTRLIAEKTNAQRDYDDAVKELESIDREKRTIDVNNEQLKLLRKYNSFCEDAIENLNQLKSNLTENIRIKVEKATESQFKKLMWKDNFSKVLINKHYEVSLIDVTGETVTPGILSAGEKLVLALSFVAALNSISGFELPFIIDTPMGRLDEEMKTNISLTLPDYVEGNQVALLVTGEEYTDKFRNGIISKVGKEYMIQVNETDVGTESKIVLR